MPVRLTRLNKYPDVMDGKGKLSDSMLSILNQVIGQAETAINNQADLIANIQAAQAAADAANAAAATAQTAASTATTAATTANETIAEIEAGTLDLSAIKVNGQRFVNNGGVLELEP